MALYKRGRVWWYDFQFNGERFIGSTKCRNKRAAEKAQAKLRTDLAMGLFGLAPTKLAPIFKKFAEGEFTTAIETRLADKPRTITFYKEKIRRLLEYKPLADARLNRIDEELINGYIQHRAAKKRKPASINRELATLRKALRQAREWKLIQFAPSVRLLPGEQPREFILSQDLEKIYLAKAPQPLTDVALLVLDTGLRVEEAVSLEWSGDVSLEPAHAASLGFVFVRKGKTKNARRIIPLTARVLAMLKNRRRFFPEAQWVFPGQRKGKHLTIWAIDNLHAELRRDTIDETGKTVFPKTFVVHSLRHTYGTRLGESGADVWRIMKLMGHSSVVVSQRYVHPTPDWMESAVKGLDAMNQLLRGEVVPTKVPTAAPKEP